jgi:hypothetical protein
MPTCFHRAHDDVVGEVVELLDLLALDVGGSRTSEDAREACFADPTAYDFGGQADLLEQPGEISGRFRHPALAIEEVSF